VWMNSLYLKKILCQYLRNFWFELSYLHSLRAPLSSQQRLANCLHRLASGGWYVLGFSEEYSSQLSHIGAEKKACSSVALLPMASASRCLVGRTLLSFPLTCPRQDEKPWGVLECKYGCRNIAKVVELSPSY
jgi:hypothetical protein